MTLSTLTVLALSAASPQIRVEGEGYMRLLFDGRAVFAREGDLHVFDGKLGLRNIGPFLPAIQVSEVSNDLEIELDGTVSLRGNRLGQIILGLFSTAPAQRDTYFVSSDRPQLTRPGEDIAGLIQFGTKTATKPTQKPEPKVEQKSNVTPLMNRETPAIQNMPATNSEELQVPAPPKGGVGIAFRQNTVVSSDTFTLGQLGKLQGDPALLKKVSEIILGDTPTVGVKRYLDLSRILPRVRAAGIDESLLKWNIPTRVSISRESTSLTDQDFTTFAITEIERRDGAFGTLKIDRPVGNLEIPPGKYEFILEEGEATLKGYRATVAVRVDGKIVTRRTFALIREGVAAPVRVGQTVRVRLLSGGVTMETTGRVTRVEGPAKPVEVQTTNGQKFIGIQKESDLIEVKM